MFSQMRQNQKKSNKSPVELRWDITSKIRKVLESYEEIIPEIYDLDKDVTGLTEYLKIYKMGGHDSIETSMHAMLLSTAASAKCARSNIIALHMLVKESCEMIEIVNSS